MSSLLARPFVMEGIFQYTAHCYTIHASPACLVENLRPSFGKLASSVKEDLVEVVCAEVVLRRKIVVPIGWLLDCGFKPAAMAPEKGKSAERGSSSSIA
eukprot:4814715-Amphidinium_carterae.1